MCDGRRGLLLGQLIRGSGRRWQADVRLRKRLGLNGAAGSLSRMKALAVEGFAALEEQGGAAPPWLRSGEGRSGKRGPAVRAA